MSKLFKVFFVDFLPTGTGLAVLIIIFLLGLQVFNGSRLKNAGVENKQLIGTIETTTATLKTTTAALKQMTDRHRQYKALATQLQDDLDDLRAVVSQDKQQLMEALNHEQNQNWVGQSVPSDVAGVFN